MIIDYLIHDVWTLKACSLTCYSWYIAACSRLHRTLVLSDHHGSLQTLSNWHALGLLPFAREIRILQPVGDPTWFLPQYFSHRDSRHFFLMNVQSLTIRYLDVIAFLPRLQQSLGHLSPTLRSLTLFSPRCTPLQLAHFISLFPNLDDIAIRNFTPATDVLDGTLTPFSTPKLRGKLVLTSSDLVGTWEHLAASCGLRFCFIHVWGVEECLPVLLDACAKTLETLRIEPFPDQGMGPHC